jgi:hypothetical protein
MSDVAFPIAVLELIHWTGTVACTRHRKKYGWDSSFDFAAPIQVWALVIDHFVATKSIGGPTEAVRYSCMLP